MGRRLRSCSLSGAQRSCWEREALIALRLWRGRIAASGGEAAYARTDVKRGEDLSNRVGLAIERYGKLDVLVNDAGVAIISLLDELRVNDWEDMIDVNLKGVLYDIAAALPVFRRQSFGYLVNVISTAGIQIIPTIALYAGTKKAVRPSRRPCDRKPATSWA